MLGFLQIDADEGKLFMFIAIAATLLREFVVSSLRMYAASAGTVIAAAGAASSRRLCRSRP